MFAISYNRDYHLLDPTGFSQCVLITLHFISWHLFIYFYGNQHFIELSPPLRNLLQQILSLLCATQTWGVTSTPPTACYMTYPREEGAKTAVNYKGPRGIIHFSYKTKNKYETSGMSQHSEYKY